MRALAMGAGMFVLVLAVLLAAVGQLGKIDGQTIVAVLASAVIAAVVAAWRARGRQS
jgi:membrane protein implicated in regulation of membrane protease activity